MRSVALAALALAAGCKRPAPPEVRAPPTVPTAIPVGELAGAAACAECHGAIVRAWRASPHGRAMTAPSAGTVLGAFDGAPFALPDGTVTPPRHAGGFPMTMRSRAGDDTRRVDFVLASGRQ